MQRYYGLVTLKYKGKIYGSKVSQINAKNKTDARKKLKKRFHHPGNTVIVKKILSYKEKKEGKKW